MHLSIEFITTFVVFMAMLMVSKYYSKLYNNHDYTSKDMKRSIIAHHYCSHIRPDLHQCVIYDSDSPDAKLIGIEYIITEETYNTLDPEEQKLWHSHQYEVKGGLITCPHIPQLVEHQIMKHIIKVRVSTIYCKLCKDIW